MKTNLVKLSILFLLLCGAAFSQSDSKRADDEKAIRANVKQMENGWNKKSGAEFAKPFAEDSDYVVINGFHIKGRAANAEGHQRIFDTIYKNVDLMLTVEQVRFLRSDVAVVHVAASRKPTAQEAVSTPQNINARITMTMVKNSEKWEIAAFQNTQIQIENR